MGATEAKAKAVAIKYKLTYLGFCSGKHANSPRDIEPNSISDKILKAVIPTWLEEISPKGDRVRVFKIRTN